MFTPYPSLQTLATGLVVAIVGFFSSFPIVLKGLAGVGAGPAEQASGLMAAAVAMGIAGIGLSLWKRMPISVAWSTPGVALLAITAPSEAGFAGAVGAFLFAGALTVIAGLWRPLGQLAASIPAPLAQAMLAGVLLSLCIVPFQAMAEVPGTALPIVLTWAVARLFTRLFAVPLAVLMAALVTAHGAAYQMPEVASVLTEPVLVMPVFSMLDILSIGLPLFIVTMATQNIPGIAVTKSYGFAPAPGPLFATVGGASILSAPLGAPATCLAAITAAMCCNEESDPDPERRYWSAVFAGVFYCLFGLFAGVITAFAGMAPPFVLGTVAGIALMGVFASSTAAALGDAEYREAAAITFLVTASGITIFGLAAAVWGLVIGGAFQVAARWLR
ncbi:MAG: benzoate/H(+) symporter BenE family transporter [Pseudomonadota bacterium]